MWFVRCPGWSTVVRGWGGHLTPYAAEGYIRVQGVHPFSINFYC